MRRMWLIAAAGVLVGCAGRTSVVSNPGAYEQLTETCQSSSDTCKAVRLTDNPGDEEAWRFEARLKVRAFIGIPYGRHPSDQYVVGSRVGCEEVRSRFVATGTPTKPCEGPVHFRRE